MLWKYYSLFINQTQRSFKIRSPPQTGLTGVPLKLPRKTEEGIYTLEGGEAAESSQFLTESWLLTKCYPVNISVTSM